MFKKSAKPLHVSFIVLLLFSILNGKAKIFINKAGVQGIRKHSWILAVFPRTLYPLPYESEILYNLY